VSFSNSQSGRIVSTLVVLVLLGAVVVVGWNYLHQPASGPHVATSAAAAQSGLQKVQAFAGAQAQARQTGKPVSAIEAFSDSEVSSLANQAAADKGLPVDQISLHATGQGTVVGSARAQAAGQDVPVSLEGVPVVNDGNRVALNVTKVSVGAVPLPGPLADQVTQSIRQPLTLGQPLTGFQNVQVKATDGQITVSGVAEPS
jgi:hypothetical protein